MSMKLSVWMLILYITVVLFEIYSSSIYCNFCNQSRGLWPAKSWHTVRDLLDGSSPWIRTLAGAEYWLRYTYVFSSYTRFPLRIWRCYRQDSKVSVHEFFHTIIFGHPSNASELKHFAIDSVFNIIFAGQKGVGIPVWNTLPYVSITFVRPTINHGCCWIISQLATLKISVVL